MPEVPAVIGLSICRYRFCQGVGRVRSSYEQASLYAPHAVHDALYETNTKKLCAQALRTLAGVDPSALTLRDPAVAAGADPSSSGRRRRAALRPQDDVARLGAAASGSYVSQVSAVVVLC